MNSETYAYAYNVKPVKIAARAVWSGSLTFIGLVILFLLNANENIQTDTSISETRPSMRRMNVS